MKLRFHLIALISLQVTLSFNVGTGVGQNGSDEGFADFLFHEGEYYRAITEYYRIMYDHKSDSTRTIKLLRSVGLCFYEGADFEGTIAFLNNNRKRLLSDSTIHGEMELYLGKAHYRLRQYPKAITSLEWGNVNVNSPFYDETQFLLGLSYARVFDWQAAVKKMRLIRPASPRYRIAEDFRRSQDGFSALPAKSPFLAGALSAVIPGAGYAYCNRKGTGFVSFVINGLLIWTLRDAVVHKQYGFAAAAGFFGIGWYVGNVTGSMDAAERYNIKLRNDLIDDLLRKENYDEYIIDQQ